MVKTFSIKDRYKIVPQMEFYDKISCDYKPFVMFFNVSNFSLGKIIIVMLFGKVAEKQMDFEKMKLLMKPIINTKIYFYVLYFYSSL